MAAQFERGLQRGHAGRAEAVDGFKINGLRAIEIRQGRILRQQAQRGIGIAQHGADQFKQGSVPRARLCDTSCGSRRTRSKG